MKRRFLSALLLLFPLVALADNPDKMDGATASSAGDAKAKNLLKATNDPDSWQLELTEGGKGEMKADGDAIVFTTLETDGTDWHVQAYQTGIDLKDGKKYVVRFKSKGPQADDLMLAGQINQEDWHEFGLHEQVGATNDFKQFEFEFTASGTVPSNNRIGFVLGSNNGSVSIKDMTLTEK